MQISKATCEEETEDVVVDGDDTATFGINQFDETDIQSAVAAAASESSSSTTDEATAYPHSLLVKQADSKDHIISALKTRIQELEEMNKEAKQKNRCLICLVFISTSYFPDHWEFNLLWFAGRLSKARRFYFLLARTLWRVLASSIGTILYFEVFLLEYYYTMLLFFYQGNKKLCPQCNLITPPTHLRRIYMWFENFIFHVRVTRRITFFFFF